MGIFDDYGIDPDTIKESSFDIDDGTYIFEIGEAETQDGSTSNPDDSFFYIDYSLFDAETLEPVGSKRAYYTLAQDGDSETKRVKQSMSFMKGDLKRLGITDLSSFDGSELIGLRGSLQLKSVPGKGARRNEMFQNIKNVRLAGEEDEAEAAPEVKKPVRKAAARPAAKADTAADDAAARERVAANRAARAAAAKSAADEPDDEAGNPFGR